MKLNKDKLKELTPYFVMGAITLGTSGFFAKYYLPDNFSDNVKQEGDINSRKATKSPYNLKGGKNSAKKRICSKKRSITRSNV